MENPVIKINKIAIPNVELFTPNCESLGIINEYELLDVRVQINKSKVSGYYLIFNNEKIRLDRFGELEYYPIGLLDTWSNYLLQLL